MRGSAHITCLQLSCIIPLACCASTHQRYLLPFYHNTTWEGTTALLMGMQYCYVDWLNNRLVTWEDDVAQVGTQCCRLFTVKG